MLKSVFIHDSEKNSVRSNISKLRSHWRTTIHSERSKGVRAYNLDSTKRATMETGCDMVKSDFYRPFIKRSIDAFFNQLYDTQTQYDVHELGGEEACEDKDSELKEHRTGSDKIEDIIEDSFQDPDARKNFFTSTKQMSIVGNGFGKAWINERKGYPETTIKHIGPFSLFFYVDQNCDFYDSGLPVIERSVCSMKSIMKEISGIGIDVSEFKMKYAEAHEERKIKIDEEKKIQEKTGKKDEGKGTVNRWIGDKRSDERIRDAKFYSDHMRNCVDKCCPRCKKDKCTCSGINKALNPVEGKKIDIYSINLSDQLHEFILYRTTENLYIYVDDLLYIKYENPISNPMGDMGKEDKKKLKEMEADLKKLKAKKRNRSESAISKLEEKIYDFKSAFGVCYDGPYHPYYKLDIDPNSGSQIHMGIGVTNYKDQLLYNNIYNYFMDSVRTTNALRSSYYVHEDDTIKVKGGVEIKNGQIPLKPGTIFEVGGDRAAGIRNMGENLGYDTGILELLNYLRSEANSDIGLTSVSGGGEIGIQRVPGAVESLRQVTLQALSPLVESMSHTMGKITLVRQKLLLNYMIKNDLDEVSVRKRRGGKTRLTRDDLKKEYHVIVNNKSLTTLQNFSTTIQKINALGQIQPLLNNPVTGKPHYHMDAVLSELLNDLNLPCDLVYTDEEFYEDQKNTVKQQAKLQKVQARENAKVQFAQTTIAENLEARIAERAQRLAEENAENIGANGAINAPQNPSDQSGTIVQQGGITPQEAQQLSQAFGVPAEELIGLTEQEILQLEQALGLGARPLVEEVEGDVLPSQQVDLGDFG